MTATQERFEQAWRFVDLELYVRYTIALVLDIEGAFTFNPGQRIDTYGPVPRMLMFARLPRWPF